MASEVLARISNPLIARSWNASNTAYSNDHFHKEEEEEEEEGDTVFAFKPSSSESGWFAPENESSFGETNMNREQFPCMRSFSNDVDATVNAAFLNKLQLLRSTLFPHSVQTVIDKKKSKRIVFTGHSSGGATAILATVWYLETYFTKKKSDDIFPEPLCLTFGAPLVGDSVFNHALGRENWSRYFVNFVTRFDVVPRIMLAPKESTKQTLPYALFQLDPRTANQENDPSIAEFYATVMKEVETAARQAGCKLLEDGENPFLDTFSSFLELSPYRPVGTFVFSTETRLVSVSNSDAILQLLFYTSQSSNEHELSQRPYQSIRDHNRYQEMVDSLGMKVVDKLELNHLAALSDLGVSTEAARDCVQVAFEAEKKRDDNQSNIDKKILEKPKDAKKPYTIVEKLDWMDTYQQQCLASGKGYYDSFKESDKPDDFTANVERAKLAGFFDDAFDKLKKGQLPDGFEGRSEWIELVTRYRRLVEPLDISNYYRHLKNRDTGSYMEQGRPKRYKHSQRLNEHKLLKEGMSAEEIKRSGCGSCFWAEVEELRGKEYVEVEEKVKKLQELLQGWIIVAEVDKKHVFMEGSTFRNWWDSLPDHHKLNYPL